jgi:pyruvate,water dikinase
MSKSSDSAFGRLLERLRGDEEKKRASRREELSFQLTYDRFREILALNDSLHQLIADLEEKLEGRSPFLVEAVIQRIHKAILDVMVMSKDLNQITDNQYPGLYEALARLNAEFEAESARLNLRASGRPVLPLSELNRDDALLAGVKMANLGEVKNALGLRTPDGFVITTAAFNLFMSANGLWERAQQLKRLLASQGPAAVVEPSRDVRESILNAPVPAPLAEEILAAYDRLAAGRTLAVALRSSAVGEDLTSSYAGQYYTELDVRRPGILPAYRFVLASLYKPYALSYAYERGQTEAETAMAVGCLAMIRPRLAGVMFSRDFRELEADRIEISLTRGLADRLVAGEQDATQMMLGPGDLDADRGGLSAAELRLLFETARRLEALFGLPQDIEWALDEAGELFLLQSRQMARARVSSRVAAAPAGTAAVLSGGKVACPGAGSGRVFHLADEAALDRMPAGAVAVARYASPTFSRIMTRAAAIVTEIGSPISHMGILAREFGVPTVVGMAGAYAALAEGMEVTVDAAGLTVYAGAVPIERVAEESPPPLLGSPSLEALRSLSRLAIPLRLTDPAAPEFTPAGCRSLHDLGRFIHEKLYEAMFRIGDRAKRLRNTYELVADLPIDVRLFDLGGGIAAGAGAGGKVSPAEVVSVPFAAFRAGLQDPRIDWRKPRAVSGAGFLSVMGESMMGPPPDAGGIGGVSFVVLSDRYLNFSIKAGYHFSTIDAFLDRNPNNNYVNFRFAGGGAGNERRERRVRFLTEVLSHMNFQVTGRGDLLLARLEKMEGEEMERRLTELGRLTLCSRQLDMLMDSDESPAFFARAFREERFDMF